MCVKLLNKGHITVDLSSTELEDSQAEADSRELSYQQCFIKPGIQWIKLGHQFTRLQSETRGQNRIINKKANPDFH